MALFRLFKNKEHTNNINHFGCLINLAFVDSEFDGEEYFILESIAQKLGLSNQERKMVLDAPENFKLGVIDSMEMRIAFMYDFFKMIFADGRLDEAEYHLVTNYIKALGFDFLTTKKIINRSIELFEKDISFENYKIAFSDLSE